MNTNVNMNVMIKHFGQLNRARADRQLLKVLATRSNSTDFSFMWINYICRSTICEIADDRIAD